MVDTDLDGGRGRGMLERRMPRSMLTHLRPRSRVRACLLGGAAALACASESEPAPPAEIPEAVQRAFDASCVAEGCHDAPSRAGGLSLEAADSPGIVGGASSQSPLPLVTLGDLGSSYMAIKLLPDAQLPAGAERFEDRMPQDGLEPDDVEHVNTILAWIAGYGPSGTGGGESSASGTGSGEGTDGTADATSADPGDGSGTTDDPDPTGNSGNPPSNPACSVEEVTEGDVSDPLDKGDAAGQIPQLVGVVLEERCGCHTLADRTLNTKYPALLAPSGTLLLDYADLSQPLDGTTLGAVLEEEIFVSLSMPPGSCPSIPSDDLAVLQKWFDDGMPDGASFTPP